MSININGNNFTDMKKAKDYFEKKLEENNDPLHVISREAAKRIAFENINLNPLLSYLRKIDEYIQKTAKNGEFNCMLEYGVLPSNNLDLRNIMDIFESLGYRTHMAEDYLKISWD